MKVILALCISLSAVWVIIDYSHWSSRANLVISGAHSRPEPIDLQVYHNLMIYAHLIDISYCVDGFHKIDSPFECDLCQEGLSNMTLVNQWYFQDAVAGYIAETSANIFNRTESHKKTIIISLRGTRSFTDTMADLNVDMTRYVSLGMSIPPCGSACRVHSGFWHFYKNVLNVIEESLVQLLETTNDYEVVLVGHSMGGSVALLVALHLLEMGLDEILLVTMGQPLVGNKAFTEWADYVLGSYSPISNDSSQRKYLRVVHKGDVVPTIPKRGKLWERYRQFAHQILLNVTTEVVPLPNQVVGFYTSTSDVGDFDSPKNPAKAFTNHNTYFRQLGLCGLHLKEQ